MAEIKITANTRAAEASLKRIESSLGRLSSQANRVDRNLSRFNQNLGNARGGVSGFGAAITRVGPVLGALGGALAATGITKFSAQIIESTKRFQTYTNQLRLITDGQEDLTRVMNLLTLAAKDNRTSFGETVDLFTKLRVSTENLGISEERVIDVTSKLSQALQVAGADGNTASSVIRQFGQAMASGEVRGDEFRSLVEGLGPALAIMARESGITVGELRTMSQAGELTAEALFKMLENSKSLTAAFQSMEPTIDQLETGLSDAFDRALVKLGEVTGATSLYEDVVKSLTRTFDRFSEVEGALVNMEIPELISSVKDESVSAADALEELKGRLVEVSRGGPMGIPILVDTPQKEEVRNAISQVKKLVEEEIKRAEEAERVTKAEQERVKSLQALKKPYEDILKLSEGYSKLDFKTPMEQALANQAEAEKVLASLIELQTKLQESDLNSGNFVDLTENIKNAKNALAGYGAEIDTLEQKAQETAAREAQRVQKEAEQKANRIQDEIKLITDKYVVSEQAQIASLEKQLQTDREFAQTHIKDKDELNAVLLEMDLYLAGEKAKIQEAITAKEKEETMKRIQEQLDAGNKILSADQQRFLQKQGDEERAKDITRTRIEFEKKSEAEKAQFAIEQGANALTALGKYNKTAFEAAKAFNIANAVMNTYMGATKALATYPPPFNFIAAAAVVASGLAQVASIRSQTYSGRQLGGPVMGNKSYIVGEAGPEVFTPTTNGSITRNGDIGGGGPVNVQFTIVANDTAGFDELLTSRQGLIRTIISDAMLERGNRSMV